MGNTYKKFGDRNKGNENKAKKVKADAVEINEQALEDIMRKGLISDHYDVYNDKILGRGHYAIVNLGVNKSTGQQVAVKRIQIAKSRVEALQREVEVLRRIGKHPNIVALFDIFITETELQLVLELLQGGELFDRMVEKGPYSGRQYIVVHLLSCVPNLSSHISSVLIASYGSTSSFRFSCILFNG